jgi:hypothetical protein
MFIGFVGQVGELGAYHRLDWVRGYLKFLLILFG